MYVHISLAITEPKVSTFSRMKLFNFWKLCFFVKDKRLLVTTEFPEQAPKYDIWFQVKVIRYTRYPAAKLV